jgi:hypothetical protein
MERPQRQKRKQETCDDLLVKKKRKSKQKLVLCHDVLVLILKHLVDDPQYVYEELWYFPYVCKDFAKIFNSKYVGKQILSPYKSFCFPRVEVCFRKKKLFQLARRIAPNIFNDVEKVTSIAFQSVQKMNILFSDKKFIEENISIFWIEEANILKIFRPHSKAFYEGKIKGEYKRLFWNRASDKIVENKLTILFNALKEHFDEKYINEWILWHIELILSDDHNVMGQSNAMGQSIARNMLNGWNGFTKNDWEMIIEMFVKYSNERYPSNSDVFGNVIPLRILQSFAKDPSWILKFIEENKVNVVAFLLDNNFDHDYDLLIKIAAKKKDALLLNLLLEDYPIINRSKKKELEAKDSKFWLSVFHVAIENHSNDCFDALLSRCSFAASLKKFHILLHCLQFDYEYGFERCVRNYSFIFIVKSQYNVLLAMSNPDKLSHALLKHSYSFRVARGDSVDN